MLDKEEAEMTQNFKNKLVWFIAIMITAVIANSCTLPFELLDSVIPSKITAAPVSEQTDITTPTKESAQLEQTVKPTSKATITPEQSNIAFNDDRYRLAFEYPGNWSLSILPAGRQTGSGFSAKTIQLTKNDTKLVIQYKFHWDQTFLGGYQPPGNLEVQGFETLLGREIPKHVIVGEGTDRYIFFGDDLEDLAIHIYLEAILSNPTDYSSADITDEIQAEAAEIMAS
ncbi:MAG: hypothetical protein ABFS03_08865, partial [Chloroflexota bacterium]